MSRLVSLKPIGRLAYIMATLLAAVVILACYAVLAKINVSDLELATHIRTVVYIIGSVTLTLHLAYLHRRICSCISNRKLVVVAVTASLLSPLLCILWCAWPPRAADIP